MPPRKTFDTAQPVQNPAANRRIIDGGKLGERIRAFHWDQTSLGPMTQWPQSLLTSVNIVLQSPVPMVMLWGPDGIMIYNDPYSVFAGARDATLLGSKVLEGWPEVAEFNHNIMEKGLRGETLSYKDQQLTLYRNNVPEEVWMDLNYSPIIDESGNPGGVLAVVVETTQHILAEAAMRDSENRFRTLADTAPVMIWMSNELGKLVYRNQAFASFFGLPDASYEDFDWEPQVHPDDLNWVDEKFQLATKTQRAFNMPEHRMKRHGGDYRWLIANGVPRHSSTGEFQGFIGTVVDITERKTIEEALQAQNDLTHTVTENATAALMIMDKNGHCIYANQAATTMTGFTLNEFIGNNIHNLLHYKRPDGSPFPVEECPLAIAYRIHKKPLAAHEDVFIRKDGSYFPVMCANSPLIEHGEVAGYVLEFRDITIEQKAKEALAASEKRFRALAEHIPNLAWKANADGWVFWYNQRWYEYTGTTPEQMKGWGWQAVHDPNVLPEVMERWQHSIATGEPFEMVFPLKGADGIFRPFLTRVVPIRDEQNKVSRWFGTNTDVTDTLQNKLALEEHNKLIHMISDAQTLFFSNEDIYEMFEQPLQELLEFTASEYGFIGEVLQDENGQPYLKCCFISNNPWNTETQVLWEKNRKAGFEFHKLDNLFGHVITSGEVAIVNDPANDSRRAPAGRPQGHPPLNRFLGIPFYKNEKLIGMVGLANRPDEYDMALVDKLKPFTDACANIIEAYRNKQALQRVTDDLQKQQNALRRTFERERLIRRIVEFTNQTFDINSLLNIVSGELGKFFNVDRCFIVRYIKDSEYLNIDTYGVYYRAADVPKIDMSDFPAEVMKVFTHNLPIQAIMRLQRFNTQTDYIDDLRTRLNDYDYIPEEDRARYFEYFRAILAEKHCTHAILRTGIQYRGLPYGTINLQQCSQSRYWTDEEVDLLQDIATQIGVAFYQTDLFHQEQEAANREMLVRQFIQAVHSPVTLDDKFQELSNQIGTYLEADHVFISRYDPVTKQLSPPTREYRSSDDVPSLLQGTLQAIGKDSAWLLEVMCKTAKPFDFDLDTPGLGPETIAYLTRQQVQSGLGIAIRFADQCLAVLFIHQTKRKRIWKEEERAIVEAVARQAAIATFQANLLEDEQKARHAAEEANRKKSEFLAMMSHELRTPLNSIIGYSQMIDMVGPLKDKQAQYVKNVEASGQHLLTIINDLLDVSKIEAGKLHIEAEPIKIAPLVDEVKTMMQDQASRKAVSLTFETDAQLDTIYGDRARIKQILINLFSNGIKFNRDNGSVTGRISKTDDGHWIVITISDTGIGIPKTKLPELFQKFYQVDNTASRRHEGTGLGLALTKELVELHRGAIAVQSDEGIGTVFTIRLPLPALQEQSS